MCQNTTGFSALVTLALHPAPSEVIMPKITNPSPIPCQAVRLPREFRFQGDSVRVRRVGSGVVLEPVLGPAEWLAELDRFAAEPFMPDGRNQPATPPGPALD